MVATDAMFTAQGKINQLLLQMSSARFLFRFYFPVLSRVELLMTNTYSTRRIPISGVNLG